MLSMDGWSQKVGAIERNCLTVAENLRLRDQHQRGSRAYIRSNREVTNGLSEIQNQIENLTDVLNFISITGEITEHEATRRQTILRNLESRYADLEQQSKSNPRETFIRNELFKDVELEQGVSWTMTASENIGNTQERIQAQQEYMQEQDQGLDRLVEIMSRTKDIAQNFNTELDLHNEIIDEVGENMETVNARLIRNTERTQNLNFKSDTCGLWIIIVCLLVAIIVVACL